MSLRGDLKVGRLKRGDLLLRAKGHFKGGPKTVDETMGLLLFPKNSQSKEGQFPKGFFHFMHLSL